MRLKARLGASSANGERVAVSVVEGVRLRRRGLERGLGAGALEVAPERDAGRGLGPGRERGLGTTEDRASG